MKLSRLIEQLQIVMDKSGELHIKSYKISTLYGTSEYSMLSETRKDKNGNRCKMSFKEFKEYCDKNKEN